MRFLLPLLLFIVINPALGQKKEWKSAVQSNTISAYEGFIQNFPESKFVKDAQSRIKKLKARPLFHIIYVENGILADDMTPLVNQMEINAQQSVKLENGYLILGHHSGKLIEFQGDTLIDIPLLAKELSKYLTYEQYFSDRTSDYVNATGAVNRPYAARIKWAEYLPSSFDVEPGTLCLKWAMHEKLDKPDNTYLKVINMFDEELERIEVIGSEYDLDLSRYQKERMIILQLTAEGNESGDYLSSYKIAIKFSEDHIYYIPHICGSEHSAIETLEIAFFYESNHDISEAQKYFDQAFKIGKNQSFQYIRDQFYNRNKLN